MAVASVPERWGKTTEPCPRCGQVPTNTQQVLRPGSETEVIRERFHHPGGICERFSKDGVVHWVTAPPELPPS